MKKTVLTFALLSCASYAQQPHVSTPVTTKASDASETATAIERMQLTHGRMVVKGYSTIAITYGLNSGRVDVEVIEVREGSTRNRGVVVQTRDATRLERTDRAYIDRDEVDALVDAATALIAVTGDVTTLTSFEAVYKTRGGLELSQFAEACNPVRFSVSTGRISKEHVFLTERPQVEEFVAALKKAKIVLDALK